MGIFGLVKGVGHAAALPLEVGTGGHIASSLTKGLGVYGAMAAAGAGIGAAATLSTDGNIDPVSGAVVGAGVGAAAIPVAGIGLGLAGRGAVATAKGIPALPGIIAPAMPAIGAAASVGAATSMALGAHAADRVWGVGRRMVRWDQTASELKHVKMTGIASGAKAGWKEAKGLSKFKNAAIGSVINGKTILAGAAIAEGVGGAWNKLVTANMGTMTGVETSTPRIPNYSQQGVDDSGATGDLVFALHNNRRG